MSPEIAKKIPSNRRITDHDGILGARPGLTEERIEIVFDPSKLSEPELRAIAARHLSAEAVQSGNTCRWVMRLDGHGCEAAAGKLERRIEKVKGVRRATATFVGRILCLTFDPLTSSETELMEGLRSAGAKVGPLKAASKTPASFWRRVLCGSLNEEISCAVGLLTLITAGILERVGGVSVWTGGLYLISYIAGGQFGLRSAIASLREKTLDVDLLMVLAALGAAAVGAPFEGALLLFLFSFSNILQHHALERTQRAIESLLTLRPEEALRKTNKGSEMVAIELLDLDDVVIVRPGELLPVDGVVVEGRSYLDESSLTGEALPVSKTVGAKVFAGTLNQSGAIEIKVARKAEDSTLARMVKLVAEAQAEKSNTQRFLEKAEQNYAAGVIGFTILVLCVPWLVFGEEFVTAFYRAMTLMVVASPCALIISTPATVLSAIGGAARRGILIKGGVHLEAAARVDIVCFDKTGTLTVGKPSVTDCVTKNGHHRVSSGSLSEADAGLLRICASVEAKSEHPLARAVVNMAEAAGIELLPASDFQSVAGKGAEAEVEGERYLVGSGRYFSGIGAEKMEFFLPSLAALQNEGKTCIWLGQRRGDGVDALAVFALADTLRPEARGIVDELHAMGVKRVVMLTGDQNAVAKTLAAETGMDEFRAELLPEDKVRAIRQFKEEGTVMMVGDGINDAPALATAHLGLAMGAAGTDIAMETADVVLMGDRLDRISQLLGMARHAKRVLIQNLTFASVVILFLAAATLGFELPLPLGVIGHEGSTVLVCLNGLRLLNYSPKIPKKTKGGL